MPRRKILVVDDSRLLHRVYDTFLTGFLVVHAHDGIEALGLLAEHTDVDVVLLDVNMPRLGGLEVLGRLQGTERHPPVVLVTTEGEEEAAQRGLAAGAAAYVRKPFHFPTVLAIIARLTNGARA